MRILEPDEAHAVKRGRRPKYDWDKWFVDGKTTELVEGEDFTCNVASIRQMAYTRAMGRGYVKTSSFQRQTDNKWIVEITFSTLSPNEQVILQARNLDIVEETEDTDDEEYLASLSPEFRARAAIDVFDDLPVETLDSRKPGTLGPA